MKTRKFFLVFLGISIFTNLIMIGIVGTLFDQNNPYKMLIFIPLLFAVFVLVFFSMFVSMTVKEKYFYVSYEKILELEAKMNSDWKEWKRRLEIIGNHEAIQMLKKDNEERNGKELHFPFYQTTKGKFYYCYKDFRGRNQPSNTFETYEEAENDYSKLIMLKPEGEDLDVAYYIDKIEELEKALAITKSSRDFNREQFLKLKNETQNYGK